MLIICLFIQFLPWLFFQSCFPRDGNLVFLLDIILFIISTFLFPSWFSIYSVVCGFMVVWLLLLCISIQFKFCCLSVFCVSIIYKSRVDMIPYLFVGVYVIFQGKKKQSFLIISLIWSARFWLVVRNVAHPSKIAIIIFLYPLCWSLSRK